MSCEKLINSINAYIEKADNDLSDELAEAGFVSAKETVKVESSLEESIARALKRQTKYILNAVKNADSLEEFAETWESIKNSDNCDEYISRAFFDEFKRSIPGLVVGYMSQSDPELAASMLNKAFGSESTSARISMRTTAWAQEWSEDLGELMKLGTHDEIEKLLTNSLANGDSIADFTRAIMDSGIRDEYYRARRVAVTEMLTAHSVAQQEAYTQSPAVEMKIWRHTGSYRNKPRENHIAMDGDTVPVDAPFTLNGADGITYYPMYPRSEDLPAGERINCHCITQPMVSEDILGLSLEERQELQQQAIDDDDAAWERELDAQNKAKAGITSDVPDSTRGVRTELGRVDGFTKPEQVKYMGGQQKWALLESGVITDDEQLLKVTTSTLAELNDDGIITISAKPLNHSNIGEFTAPTSTGIVRHKSGSHGQDGLNACAVKGVVCNVNGTYSNGVRIGDIPDSKQKYKHTGNMQSWFPESWTAEDIRVAGTYVANSGAPLLEGYHKTAEFKGIAVRILTDSKGKVTSISPDLDQSLYVKGVELI